jgi:hypothetical protein
MCRSRLKRENVEEVKTKEAIIESSSDGEYAYTIKKKTEHVSVVSHSSQLRLIPYLHHTSSVLR